MECSHLIQNNTKNIILEKLYTISDEETILRLFSIKSKLNTCLNYWLQVSQFAFIVCQVEGYLKILKLSCRPHAVTSCKAF